MRLVQTLIAASVLAFSSHVMAEPTQTVPTLVTPCTNDSFQITAAKPSALPGALFPIAPAIDATSCYGVMSGNDDKVKAPDPNLGYLGDGLLNGGTTQQGVQYFDPVAAGFITASQLLALEDPNAQVDPGWIRLGTLEGGSGELNYETKPLDFGGLLTFMMNANGTWSLAVDPNIKQLLEAAGIFDRSSFDHLTFVVKAGNENTGDGGWAIYDFDFNLLQGFDLSVPYTMEGNWNMDDFGGKQISHLSVWARDPITNDVPAPGTLLLIGIGALALSLIKRKPQN